MIGFGSPRPLVCEGCGTAFACGADTGACWCTAVRTDPLEVERLSEQFARCLCPSCLEARAGV